MGKKKISEYSMPVILEDYLNYMETIRGKSPLSVSEYFFDLRTFYRFCAVRFRLVEGKEYDKIRNNCNKTKARKIASLKGDVLTVIGKGDKERMVYLNDACKNALDRYLEIRPIPRVKDDALFLSNINVSAW